MKRSGNFPSVNHLLEAIEQGLQAYAEEDERFSNTEVVDVFLVGSVGTDGFRPGDSDLDICVILNNTPKTGVQAGIDTFYREDWQQELHHASEMNITGVDVGVYGSDNYTDFIDDEKVYSCQYRSWVKI